MTTCQLIFFCLHMKRPNKSVRVIFTPSFFFSPSIVFILCLTLSVERKMIDSIMQWTFAFLAPRNEDRQSSIRPAPATASQGLNIWLLCFDSIYLHSSYSAVWTGVCYSTPKKLQPAKLSQILLMLSILLLLIPLHCLFISALCCMAELDWFGFRGWETGKLGG